jgi:spore germination protein KC
LKPANRWIRKAIIIIFIAIIMLISTGCWSRRELSELAVAVAMGIDSTEGGYLVSVQIVNAQETAAKQGSGYTTPVSVYTMEGKTVYEALRRMSVKLNRKLYLSHMRIVAIGEEAAKRGVNDMLDLLSRHPEIRTDFYIVVTRDIEAVDLVSSLTPLEKIPANKLFTSLTFGEKNWGAITGITLDEMLTDLLSEGKHPAVTGIEIVGETDTAKTKENLNASLPPAFLQFSGLAAFHKDKLVGWLNERESTGYNLTQGYIQSTIIALACPQGGHIGVEMIRSDEKIKAYLVGEKPEVRIQLRVEGNIGDVHCNIDVTNEQTIQRLELLMKQELESFIQASVQKAKKLKTDLHGFGEALHRDNPQAWKRMKKDWDQHLTEVSIRLDVDAFIRRTGTITNPIGEIHRE